jgi:hypothetical protein
MCSSPSDVAFLTEAVGRGSTVVVFGSIECDLGRALARAAGHTGLIVDCRAIATKPCHGIAQVRGALASAPLLSHVADVVILLDAGFSSPETLAAHADEARRLLAPRGVFRACGVAVVMDQVAVALRQCAFRDVQAFSFDAGHRTCIRARGPR